jgi:hypothetical protein
MKLVKLAVMLSVALFAALLVSDNGALASISSRTIATGSAYSTGIVYPVKLDVLDGKYKRQSQTCLMVNYGKDAAGNSGVGTLTARNVDGVFQGAFSTAEVSLLTTTAGPSHSEHWFQAGFNSLSNTVPSIQGTYTNAANESVDAVAFVKIGSYVTGTYSYWDFSYNVATGTASAVQASVNGGNLVSLIVKNATTGEYYFGNGTPNICPPVSYAFFSESADVDSLAGTVLGSFGGVIDVRP